MPSDVKARRKRKRASGGGAQAELRARWNAQFKEKPDAFLNDGLEEKKVYGMFPVFVRMVLLKERKG